jgi:hypothetical protein
MLLLANAFAFGSLAGGAVAAFLACLLIGDATASFPFMCIGYSVVGCISGAIYAPVLKVLGFGRRQVTRDDARRALITAAVCMVGEYLFAVVARSHENDRLLLFTVPLVAALVDTVRVRAIKQKALTEPQPELVDSMSADR